jgi:hypothetical protein
MPVTWSKAAACEETLPTPPGYTLGELRYGICKAEETELLKDGNLFRMQDTEATGETFET